MAMLRATQRLIALCSPRAAQASGERAGWGAIYPAARHACKGQIETTCGGEMLHRVHGKRVPRSTIAMYLRSAGKRRASANSSSDQTLPVVPPVALPVSPIPEFPDYLCG
ncbi:hypothetical protein B0H14DRAFT_2563312 [Mycena olivaceomarginata]|nr:hypothetical protein B0H14DRAFT_2563312 [Mycena olivaceomarginata]